MKVWDYESDANDKLSKQLEKDNTIVMTKSSMAKYLMERLYFNDNDVLLEPCRGDGAFYNNFPSNTINKWCEINEGIDFLKWDEDDKVDYCISNPPFVPRKLFWSFNQKAMRITNKGIYWLLSISSFNVFTPKRLEEMEKEGWYIQSFHIVSDKRWYGRYVFIHISREKNDLFSWNKNTF